MTFRCWMVVVIGCALPATTLCAAQPELMLQAAVVRSAHGPLPGEPSASEAGHVPPPPPQRPMRDMSSHEMVELMQMDDDAALSLLLIDQLEWGETGGADALLWELEAWYGDDYDKAWLKSEGNVAGGDVAGRNELLWDRVVARWWSTQVGLRHDVGAGPSRTWAAFGIEGLAPHWFEVEATMYVGDAGRTALRVAGEHELLITQRLVLQAELELNAYGKSDVHNGIGSGLSDVEAGVRFRYEVRRELAPYVGVGWTRQFSDTADLARADNRSVDDFYFVAGLRLWF